MKAKTDTRLFDAYELIAKYELYVTKKVITTYELDDFFKDEN